MKKLLWVAVSSLMALSLVMAACAPAGAPTTPAAPTTPTAPAAPTIPAQEKPQEEAVKPSGEVPKYGGTLMRVEATDVTNFDVIYHARGGITIDLTQQGLWAGDWAKGPAGGYGTNETDWVNNYDIWDHKTGLIAESTKWTVDEAKNQGTIVYQIRKGIRWALNPASEASRLVAGRELTADDVLFNLKRTMSGTASYLYRANPNLRPAEFTKTGPWEITVKIPLDALITGIMRFGDGTTIGPPEVINKYGNMETWKLSVGTGAFMLTDVIPGSVYTFVRNPNFWIKDPVGPGKGNQIPYLDGVKILVMPDLSTRQAALRTGKIDQMDMVSLEDALQFQKTTPALKYLEKPSNDGRGTPAMMRTDKAPFNDVRVRRAMIMAIDYQTILKNMFQGHGNYVTYPYNYTRPYAEMYLGPDDPEMPASVKELFVYNPERAKQLLKEAGYPNGFKTEILLSSTATGSEGVDYYSIIKDMWAKVGIELTLDPKESAVLTSIQTARTHNALSVRTTGPQALFHSSVHLQGASPDNQSMLDDPVINDALVEVRRVALKDLHEAMKVFKKKIAPYVLDQAYAIPNVAGSYFTFWWPWLKNYSGEKTIGYDDFSWPQYIWYDTALKKKMGY